MINRYGGFRTRRLLTNWNDRKSPSSSQIVPPATIQDFMYSTAQGIWSLRSTTQFPNTFKSYQFVASSNSTDSATITVPAAAQSGDIAILVDSTAVGAAATPSGWTSILSLDNPLETFETSISYKILEAGDASSSITGQTTTTYSVKIMLVFRPSSTISMVNISSLTNSGETAAVPSVQTIAVSPYGAESIVIGVIRAYQNEPFINETTWDDSVYVSEGNGNSVKVFYEIQQTNTQRTITTSADYGSYNFAAGFVINGQ